VKRPAEHSKNQNSAHQDAFRPGAGSGPRQDIQELEGDQRGDHHKGGGHQGRAHRPVHGVLGPEEEDPRLGVPPLLLRRGAGLCAAPAFRATRLQGGGCDPERGPGC